MVNPGLIQGIAGIQKGVHTKIKRMVICQGHKVKPQFPENPHPLRREPEGKLLILCRCPPIAERKLLICHKNITFMDHRLETGIQHSRQTA